MRPYITAVLGVVLFAIACDREAPTDVPVKTASPVVGTPSLAMGGKPTASSYEIKTSSIPNVASGSLAVIEVFCSTGKRALGGGFKADVDVSAPGTGPDVAIYESTPRVTTSGFTDGWRIEALNRTADPRTIEAWVICAAI